VGRRPRVGDCWKMDVSRSDAPQAYPPDRLGAICAGKTVASILERGLLLFLAINPRTLMDIEKRHSHACAPSESRCGGRKNLFSRCETNFERIARRAKRFRKRPRPRVFTARRGRIHASARLRGVSELIDMAGGEAVVPAGDTYYGSGRCRARALMLIILAWTAAGARSKPSSALRNNWVAGRFRL